MDDGGSVPAVSAANPVDDIAKTIAAEMYGAIELTSPQWLRCLRLAKDIANAQGLAAPVSEAFDTTSAFTKPIEITNLYTGPRPNPVTTSFPAAKERAQKFNQAYPLKTEGYLMLGGYKMPTRVEGIAMTFPDPKAGELVMAWFLNVGWRDIGLFTAEAPKLTAAQELFGLAMQAKGMGRADLGQALVGAALDLDPDNHLAMNERAIYLAGVGEFEAAIKFYDRILEIEPSFHEVLNNRSMAYRALGRLDEAVSDCRLGMKFKPAEGMILLNAAATLNDAGAVDESLELLDRHIKKNPDDTSAQYNRSLVLLGNGRYADGWAAFESRLRMPMTNAHYEHWAVPRWQGGNPDDLKDKAVLVWMEQGLGDEVMIAGILPDLIATGAKITLLCLPRLTSLFQRSFPEITVAERPPLWLPAQFTYEPIPGEYVPAAVRRQMDAGGFDCQLSFSDLGALFRPTLESFPKRFRYLKVSPELVNQFAENLAGMTQCRRVVGISWKSQNNIRTGKFKGTTLKEWGPILRQKALFVNLQYGLCADELAEARKEFGCEIVDAKDLGVDALGDLDAYAALVSCCDMVISVSNTAVHFAGALGVPTEVLTPTGPGCLWYWGKDGLSSPWYSSVILHRQKKPNDWADPINEAAWVLG